MDDDMNTIKCILDTQASLLATALRKAVAASRPLAEDQNVHNAVAMLEALVYGGNHISDNADDTINNNNYQLTTKVALAPFLECLKSHEISGPLVLLTVESIKRLIEAGIMEQDIVGSQEFLLILCKSLNQTRFEATDLAIDEVVLFQLLSLIDTIVDQRQSWHQWLSDAALVACFETMLSLLIPRFSELLKTNSESALVKLTRSIFKQFTHLERFDDNVAIQIPGRKGSDANGKAVTDGDSQPTTEHSNSPALSQQPPASDILHPFSKGICDAIAGFIGRVLQGSDKKSMERLLPVALKMAAAMFEAGKEHLFVDPIFMKLVDEPIIKELIRQFGLLPGLFGDLVASLVSLLFANHRHHLHGQHVFFMNHLVSLMRGKAAVGQLSSPARPSRSPQREAVLDLLLYLSKESNFLSDLYGLYECDPLFQFSVADLVSCVADQTGKHVEKMICKKAVLVLQNFAKHVADGCVQLKTSDGSVGRELREKYALKVLHAKAAEVFNNKPKEMEAFLVEHDLLPAEHSREDLARQVRRINGLHKRRLGEWLAKPGNEDIAKAFLADLDFRGRRIDDAMRLMLATFRLPGESQEINRLMEAFAPVLYEQCKAEPATRDIFASVDSVYIMAYSVIMLNTDQHNPQYKGRRMTEDDFIRNNRGNNEGKDYDRDFLRSVYHAIRYNEILMPEEHEGDTAFNHRYSETVNVASIHYPTQRQSVSVELVGGELLPMLWDPILQATTDLFEQQSQVLNDTVVSRAALRTLYSLAVAAGALNQPDRMDELIMSMWTCSNIEKYFKSTSAGNVVPRYLAKVENGRELVRLLVDTFKRHGEVIRTGWKQLVELVFILHESRVISSESFAGNSGGGIADGGKTAQTPKSANDRGDLPAGEKDNVMRVSEFMSAECHFEDIFLESRLLSDDALSSMLSAFLSIVSASSTWSRSTKALSIDICIYCALQNRDRLSLLWSVLFGALSEVCLRGQDEVLREHAIVGLGRLSLKMAEREEQDMRGNLIAFLQFLCNLPPDAFDRVAEPILAMLLKIVELDGLPGRAWCLLSGGADIWPPYFTIMSLVGRKRQCAPYTLGLLMAATTERAEPKFPLDFFTEYLDLLSAFVGSCQAVDSATPSPNTNPPTNIQSSTPAVSPVDMAKTAIKRLCDLEAAMSKLEGIDTFAPFSLPIHSALAVQCGHHSSRDIRQHALMSLQRLVMSRPWRSGADLNVEFDSVLFTLLDELQSDAMVRLNGTVEDTQMAAASFVTKVFLNNLPLLQQGDPSVLSRTLLTLLQKLLAFLRFRSDTLIEGIPETIKNVLFVLKTTTLLSEESWGAVWAVTEQILPDLRRDLGMARACGDPSVQAVEQEEMAMMAPAASPSAVHYV